MDLSDKNQLFFWREWKSRVPLHQYSLVFVHINDSTTISQSMDCFVRYSMQNIVVQDADFVPPPRFVPGKKFEENVSYPLLPMCPCL